jgi:glycosyltransferase involved in cell wall biosynthesis
MDRLPRVAILLALFEPNEFLIKQIQSIQAQTGVDLTFYIGDDGSDPKIIKQFKGHFPENHHFFEFQRVGPGQNFMELLTLSGDEDYFAFADQDDVWLEDKLIKHIKVLSEYENVIAGSHSNSALLVGEKVSKKVSRCREHDIKQLITENCVQGCTLIINKKARDAIILAKPTTVKWHDWWIGLILASTGKLVFIPGTDTLYRLHSKNVIGQPKIFKRIKNSCTKPSGILLKQGENLRDSFANAMSQNAYQDLENWIHRWDRNFFGRAVSGFTDVRRRSTWVSDLARRFFSIMKRP